MIVIGVRSTFLKNVAIETGRARLDSESRNVHRQSVGSSREPTGFPYKAAFERIWIFYSSIERSSRPRNKINLSCT